MAKSDLMIGRKTGNIVGMPVYCLDHGMKLGNVKDVLYDGENSRLQGVTMERTGVFSPTRFLIPFDQIKSLGSDVIVVESEEVIMSGRAASQVTRGLDRKGSIKGKAVLTESGTYLGRIADILIDGSTGRAVSYEVTTGFASDIGSGRNYVAAPQAVKVGVDAVIVPDETETTFREQEPGGLAGAYKAAAAKGSEIAGGVSQYTLDQEASLAKGKVAGRDVTDDAGRLIVAKGQVITDEVISLAQSEGKVHDVALAAGVGTAAAGYERARGGVLGAAGEQLKGKTVPRDITDQQGRVIIPRGTVVNDETLALADEAGVTGPLASAIYGEKTRTGAESAWDRTREWASGTWSGLSEKSRESADYAARRKVVSDQKNFLKGKVSAVDVRDDKGNVILAEGEVITPLKLDDLDRAGKLDMVKLMPEGQPAVGPEEEVSVSELHVILENPEEHKHHRHEA